MGILEFFGTLARHEITSTSIKNNYSEKSKIEHLLIDFNSIIHVASAKVVSKINGFMKDVLKTLYKKNTPTTHELNELFILYEMTKIQKNINVDDSPKEIIKMFHEHFNQKYLDALVILEVIKTLKNMLNVFVISENIKTLYIAIDGVPSKGKMIEQRQRRYIGALTESYKKIIFGNYVEYLKSLDNYVYYAEKYPIKWSKGKITPGTAFMEKMARCFDENQKNNILNTLKRNRPNMKIVISDTHEVGEGEKKIMNYVKKYLKKEKNIVVYSPDADVILLCMLLPLNDVRMLRYNQQTENYDMIMIEDLKKNISYFFNENKEGYDTMRISDDVVCISTLFGNDFVPKIETINVKRGFQDILDSYFNVLNDNKGKYLVEKKGGIFKINFEVLKKLFKSLLTVENDFIDNNNMYNKYINYHIMKKTFPNNVINEDTINEVISEFTTRYNQLKTTIESKRPLDDFVKDNEFMDMLRSGVNYNFNGTQINVSKLSNREIINLIKNKFFENNRKMPNHYIRKNVFSRSIKDYHHTNKTAEKNEYEKEIYKFDNMLDKYADKLSAKPLDLSRKSLNNFYEEYFGTKLSNKQSDELKHAVDSYLTGLVWVFEYYYNDDSYINNWYYEYERAPLLTEISRFLEDKKEKYFNSLKEKILPYKINDISKFFNPVEQLIYVSPKTDDMLKLIPKEYKEFINNNKFFDDFFVDVDKLATNMSKDMKRSDPSNIFDCKGAAFFTKCLIKPIHKPDKKTDEKVIKLLRTVKIKNPSTRIRIRSSFPEY